MEKSAHRAELCPLSMQLLVELCLLRAKHGCTQFIFTLPPTESFQENELYFLQTAFHFFVFMLQIFSMELQLKESLFVLTLSLLFIPGKSRPSHT